MIRERKLFSPILLTVALLTGSSTGYPCTTFVLQAKDVLAFGRNLDWFSGTGLLVVNPRNLKKTGIPVSSGKSAEWVSKYGSVTFNQIGRELPYGGMNEAGLVVEHMTLERTIYPASDSRQAVMACQWIQYQLDTCSTVEEVIASDAWLRISDSQSKYHFLTCDRSGRSAVIEFIEGKMVSYSGAAMPVPVLANSTYAESLERYNRTSEVAGDGSIRNFATAAAMVKANTAETTDTALAYAFSILSSVSQGLFTKWSIVYDLRKMDIHFKVFETPYIDGPRKIFRKPVGTAVIKSLSMKALDFDCNRTPKVVDLEMEQAGSVTPLMADYTSAINLASINKAFDFFKKWPLPIEIKTEDMVNLSEYPNSLECTQKR